MPDSMAPRGTLSFYWQSIIRWHLRAALWISFLMLASAVFEMATIAMAVPLLEAITQHADASASSQLRLIGELLTYLGFAQDTNALVFSLLVIANLLFLIHSGFMILSQYALAKTGFNLRRTTKSALFDRFIHAPYEEVAKRGRGGILNTVEGLADRVQSAISQLGSFFTSIFTAVLLLILMLHLSWWATVVIGALALFGVTGVRRVTDKRSREAGGGLYAARADQTRLVVDAVDGIRIVKAHALESRMSERLQKYLNAEVRPTLRLAVLRGLPTFLNEFAAATFVLILAGISFLMPAYGMTFAKLVSFLLAIRRCSPAVATVNTTLVDLASIRKDVEVIEDVLRTMPAEASGTRSLPRVTELRLKNISFCYPGQSNFVLDSINMTMKRGTVTAIVGHTGSGKSTVASLVVGFYQPTSGSIQIDGIDLSEIRLPEWRRRIGFVSQEVFLFNGTIRDNIALWDNSISQDSINQAADLAQLHKFVMTLPDGYATMVGDRGMRLSGGQCQRVAIARAILCRPDVLIFDEATSALDNLTERAVYEAMRVLRDESIIVAIAHRLSTIRDADQIMVLEGGKIIEAGTHESLLREGGMYTRLYESDFFEGARPVQGV